MENNFTQQMAEDLHHWHNSKDTLRYQLEQSAGTWQDNQST